MLLKALMKWKKNNFISLHIYTHTYDTYIYIYNAHIYTYICIFSLKIFLLQNRVSIILTQFLSFPDFCQLSGGFGIHCWSIYCDACCSEFFPWLYELLRSTHRCYNSLFEAVWHLPVYQKHMLSYFTSVLEHTLAYCKCLDYMLFFFFFFFNTSVDIAPLSSGVEGGTSFLIQFFFISF